MLNGINQHLEDKLRGAFEAGYFNASSSLSKMLNLQIGYTNSFCGCYRIAQPSLAEPFWSNKGNLLITTDVFGDLKGKSYLFLSDKEVELLTNGIPIGKDPKVNLKEEFLKEVDNILSASVITKLSNELKLKMYGDVPLLQGKTSAKIEDLFEDDFGEETQAIYFNSMSFSFVNHLEINPTFIWVLNSAVLESINAKSII
jgi:chemotaxis protein CheY-P-specific phosphatase CheC